MPKNYDLALHMLMANRNTLSTQQVLQTMDKLAVDAAPTVVGVEAPSVPKETPTTGRSDRRAPGTPRR